MVTRRVVRPAAVVLERSDDPSVEALSRKVSDLQRSLPAFVTQGVVVSFSVAGSGAFSVNHGLGRVAEGWFVVDRNSPANVYRMSTGNTASVLALYSSAACAGKIWVF